MTDKLPPQPAFERVIEIAGKHDTEKYAGLAAFGRELMQEHGESCYRKALSDAAAICDGYWPSEVYDPERGLQEGAANECARLIRSLIGKQD